MIKKIIFFIFLFFCASCTTWEDISDYTLSVSNGYNITLNNKKNSINIELVNNENGNEENKNLNINKINYNSGDFFKRENLENLFDCEDVIEKALYILFHYKLINIFIDIFEEKYSFNNKEDKCFFEILCSKINNTEVLKEDDFEKKKCCILLLFFSILKSDNDNDFIERKKYFKKALEFHLKEYKINISIENVINEILVLFKFFINEKDSKNEEENENKIQQQHSFSFFSKKKKEKEMYVLYRNDFVSFPNDDICEKNFFIVYKNNNYKYEKKNCNNNNNINNPNKKKCVFYGNRYFFIIVDGKAKCCFKKIHEKCGFCFYKKTNMEDGMLESTFNDAKKNFYEDISCEIEKNFNIINTLFGGCKKILKKEENNFIESELNTLSSLKNSLKENFDEDNKEMRNIEIFGNEFLYEIFDKLLEIFRNKEIYNLENNNKDNLFGLKNEGNNCFLNSILQNLFPYEKEINKMLEEDKNNNNLNDFISCFKKFINGDLNFQEKVKYCIRGKMGKRNGGQEDAGEALSETLNLLDKNNKENSKMIIIKITHDVGGGFGIENNVEDFKLVQANEEKIECEFKTLKRDEEEIMDDIYKNVKFQEMLEEKGFCKEIYKVFGVLFFSYCKYKCSKCDNLEREWVQISFDYCKYIDFDKDYTNFYDTIFKENYIDEYKCEGCKQKNMIQKFDKTFPLGDCFIFFQKLYSYDHDHSSKIKSNIIIRDIFAMFDKNFEITGIATHCGGGIWGGHYIAFIKKKYKWYKISDGSVGFHGFSLDKKYMENAYLVFYKRKKQEKEDDKK